MKILFLCVANSARSQMAEGLAKKILGNEFEIESAGSEPSGKVHEVAIQVMKDSGIDISKNYSKSINDLPADFINSLDYVITLCAEESCPLFISKAKKLSWSMSDPARVSEKERLDSFNNAKFSIEKKLKDFKKFLVSGTPQGDDAKI